MLLRQPSEGDVQENSKQPTMSPQQQPGTPEVEKAPMPGTDITLQLSTSSLHALTAPATPSSTEEPIMMVQVPNMEAQSETQM